MALSDDEQKVVLAGAKESTALVRDAALDRSLTQADAHRVEIILLRRTQATLAALTAAVEALADSQGLDPAAVTALLQAAVDDALEGLSVTLTNEAV